MKARKGFTLVEILIVVVILGILAAIVIPQFTDASTQSKLSSCRTTLQSMRSQIELYKIQHNDDAPALDEFATQMTTKRLFWVLHLVKTSRHLVLYAAGSQNPGTTQIHLLLLMQPVKLGL